MARICYLTTVMTSFRGVISSSNSITSNGIIKQLTRISAACLILFTLTSHLFGKTIIVNQGESINDKMGSLQPGDTLLVRAGTYNEGLSLPRNGSPGQNIVMMAYPEEQPVIAASDPLLNANKNYWLIKGIIFDNENTDSDAIEITGHHITFRDCEFRNGQRDGIEGSKTSHNITIENCLIHDFIWEPGSDAHGIVLDPGAHDWKILNSTIYNCGGDCIQLFAEDETPIADYSKNITISGNIFYTTLGEESENALDFKGVDGCLVDGNELYGFENKAWVVQKGCRNITASNNFIHDSDRGAEFRGEANKSQENIRLIRNVFYNIRNFYALKFDDVSNVEILNNTLVNISASSFRVEEQGINGGVIRNNLMYNCESAAIKATFNVQSDHNGWFNADAGGMQGAGDITGSDPQFTNKANAGYDLQANSPARDKGIDVGLPFVGSKPDLGAFEFGDVSTPVELTSFSVQKAQNGALLQWQTAFERNLLGFDIERKTNSKSFAKVSFISSRSNTSGNGQYEFMDKNISEGRYAYRLKQIDLDGSF